MHADIDRILVPKDEIAARVAQLGQQIAADLLADLAADQASAQTSDRTSVGPANAAAGGDGRVVIIPVLTGALIFASDLIRQLPIKLSLRMVAISSYPGKSMESKGVKLASELPHDLAGKHVLIIDDILDSGQTLGVVRELIERQGPATCRCAVLLRKPESKRIRPVEVEYVGFDIPESFVVGYGLDYDGYYRNYPAIATLRTDVL